MRREGADLRVLETTILGRFERSETFRSLFLTARESLNLKTYDEKFLRNSAHVRKLLMIASIDSRMG